MSAFRSVTIGTGLQPGQVHVAARIAGLSLFAQLRKVRFATSATARLIVGRRAVKL
jgi:hypothetical protein